MASRTTIRGWLIEWLGTTSDDPAYTSTILNDLLEQARKSLVSAIHEAAPGYLSKTVTLTGASNTYALTSLASDFAKALEVRVTNAAGTELTEIRVESINRARGNFYALTGEDTAATLYTAANLTANADLYFRFAYNPAEWTSDAAAPAGIPAGFHDVVGLEAVSIAFSLGSEGEMPKDIAQRWQERRAALLAHVQSRSAKPTAATTVLDRAGIRSALRGLLGVAESKDIADESLNLAILQAEQSLVSAIRTVAPQYLSTVVTLTGSGNSYVFASQSPVITDFAKVLELRLTDASGAELTELRQEALNGARGNFYAIRGLDTTVTIQTASNLTSNANLYLRYAHAPTLMAADTDTPAALPTQFRDVLALEAVPLVTGGKNPHEARWNERRAALLAHVQERSAKPSAAATVLDRAGIRSALRGLLGVREADKVTNESLNLAILQAEQSLLAAIRAVAPEYLSKVVALTGSGNAYAFASQSPAVTDFAKALEVRVTNSSGAELTALRLEALNRARGNFYSITGDDSAPTLYTSTSVTSNAVISLRYAYTPTLMAADTDTPASLPATFRDVIALEAVPIILGGKNPHEERWKERRGALLEHVALRSVKPTAAVSVLDRAGIRSALRGLLGIAENAKLTDETLNLAILQAEQTLNAEIEESAPGYHSATATLVADSPTGHVYTLSTQAAPITNFAGWLEVRWTDENGAPLREARVEELRDAGCDYFAIVARDDIAALHTSKDSTAGEDVFLRYRTWPTLMAADTDVPGAIPPMFCDVVALEAVPLVLGGKHPHSPRWMDRRTRLFSHVGRRGIQNSRTRLDPTEEPV